MTLIEYLEKQIVKLFDDAATQIASGEVLLDEYSADEWAGMPMAIVKAQGYMIRCWREFAAPRLLLTGENDPADP